MRLLAVCLASTASLATAQQALDLRLPTENTNLFSGRPEQFYMYVDRSFEGTVTKPWEGGCYGFVRSPVRCGETIVYSQFHEGIDIAPVRRDPAGNPLDSVSAISKGTVVYANTVGSHSNYGKNVVVQHDFVGGPMFSLYAHLAEISCKPGDAVETGSPLGRMGCTGVGLNRTRAHVHLELAMLLSPRFDDWHAAFSSGTNYHGIYNGINLTGLDVATLFLKQRQDPSLTIPSFVTSLPAHFKVTVPRTGMLEIATRYPWLLRGQADVPSPSWEITLTATGLPLVVAPSQRPVTQPLVTEVTPSPIPQRYLTRGILTGQGNSVSLSNQGRQFVALLTGDFPTRTALARPADAPPPAARSTRPAQPSRTKRPTGTKQPSQRSTASPPNP